MKAEGWMKEALTTQRNGINRSFKWPVLKQGRLGRRHPKKMDRWEDFEQTGYWADGALRCGYLIDDPG